MITYAVRYLGTVLNNSEFEPLKNRLILGETDAANRVQKGVRCKRRSQKRTIKPLTEEEPSPV